jgi:hypothetical protein
MALYRKRPVIIDAVQVTKELVTEWAKGNGKPKEAIDLDVWWVTMFADDTKTENVIDEERSTFSGKIRTLEGDMDFKLGDWLIRGIKNELYPCKDEIFRETYEEGNEPGIIGG